MTIEHAAEHQLPHRPPVSQIGEEFLTEDPLRQCHHEVEVASPVAVHVLAGRIDLFVGVALVETVPAVHDESHATLRTQCPQRVPVVVVERRLSRNGDESGHVHADKTVVGEPIRLGQRDVEVSACADRSYE